MTLTVSIDRDRALALAGRLVGIEPRKEHFLPRPTNPDAGPRLVDYYLAWVGICQQTRTLRGAVDGVTYRGSDYLAHRLRTRLDEEPARFHPRRLADVTASELRAWLSDDGRPDSSALDRVDERVWLLRDLGARLDEGYGTGAGLLAASKGVLGGPRGLLERLSKLRAYRDPVRKKSFLLIQFLRSLGVFEPVDPNRMGLPVDYHILRVFLRAGVITLRGDRAASLLRGDAMDATEDQALREAGVEVGRLMGSVLALTTLDMLLWMVGRNCCFDTHPPVCRTGPCRLEKGCSLRASTDLECRLRCPLDGICEGSYDGVAALRHEPSFDTDLY
jgi:hypothetical protein